MRRPSIILETIPNRSSTHKERDSCYRTLKQGAGQKIGLIKTFIATYSKQKGWPISRFFGSSLLLESVDARPLKITVPSDIKTLYNQQIPSSMCPLIEDFCERIRESRDPQSDFLLSTFLIALLKSLPHLIPSSYFPCTLADSDPLVARSKLIKPFMSRVQDREMGAAYLKIAFLCTLANATKRDYLCVEQLCDLFLPRHYFTNDSIIPSQSGYARTTASFLALLDEMIAPRTPYAVFMPELEQARNDHQLGERIECETSSDQEADFKASLKKDAEARARLTAQAKSGDITAHYYLGAVFESEKNWLKAQGYYASAAMHGHVLSMYQLGRLYQEDRQSDDLFAAPVIEKDVARTLRWWRRAVATGYCMPALHCLVEQANSEPQAALQLGKMYECGEGFESNATSALDYYRQAHSLGSAEASFKLGQSYEKGTLGILKDMQKACRYYLEAARHGHIESLAILARLLNTVDDYMLHDQFANLYWTFCHDKSAALQWYLHTAERNLRNVESAIQKQPKLAIEMARSYEIGHLVAYDQQKAFQYYALAARSGHTEAKATLESAAVAGTVSAQYALGRHYFKHLGETSTAVHWCARAAEQGHTEADAYLNKTSFSAEVYVTLARLYERGSEGVGCNDAKAVMFYRKAGALNHTPALLRLGEWYQVDHPHQAKNLSQAFQCYQRAADLGCEQALPALWRLAQNRKAWQKQLLRGNHSSFFRKKQASQVSETSNTPSPTQRSS